MTFPGFYTPAKVGTRFPPDTQAAISAGLSAGLRPASQDSHPIMLLLVDPQVDFIHEDGALSVPGAVADTRRTIEWIFRNAAELTAIAASLDSHIPVQIFYPTWWADQQGKPPAPYTTISAAEVTAGRWIPIHEPDWSVEYVQRLEAEAKKTLMIWPYHTMIGTVGHAITPALYEAIAFHAGARDAQPQFLSKGFIPRTEHYSILEPEVKVPEEAAHGGVLNEAFLQELVAHDLVYIAGQAKSHCVLETIRSIVNYFHDQPETLRKFRVLVDCTSSVVHPEIDFDAIAEQEFAGFETRGIGLVRSGDPLG